MNQFTSHIMLAPVMLSAQCVQAARVAALAKGRPFLDVLEEQSGLAPREFSALLGASFGLRCLSPQDLEQASPDFERLPFTEASRRRCLCLRLQGGALTAAIADPFDQGLREWARFALPAGTRLSLVQSGDLDAYLARQEEAMSAMTGLLGQESGDGESVLGVEELSLMAISEDASPVVRLVNSTLYDAFKSGASDIHLESEPAGLEIRYRIDGVLSSVGRVHGLAMAQEVISRIKVMSELDISETRIPQDGRFKVSVRNRPVDLRVSVMPSMYGEDAVLRILDKRTLAEGAGELRLEVLGLDPESIRRIRKLSNEPYGMVLVTGPTGSGKTTTLYAALTEINLRKDKIVTIEDPVEYQLPGVLQIPVNEKKGLTFARGLRSILRHDPDKILVGEIRDPETAQIAVQSALTGHLVFTSVHANSAFDVIGRFKHMGVDPYSFVSALNGIVAQRLVRINCPDCRRPAQPDAQMLAESGIEQDAAHYHFMAGQGCGTCRGTGFKGRKAIAEFLVLNDELREMIVANAPIRQIKEASRKGGTRFLREAALELVRTGETTLEEINRVTFV
ncbi:MAG: GspE/PulE family protein [Burkholderiales bacterium]|nr:GspE/PulE family protein [Burkholderiales bacterium]